MKRVEAYHILGKMWEDATPEQAEAISMAQHDLEFVDLMPDDMIAVVRCAVCVNHDHCLTEDTFKLARLENPFCCLGKRKDGEG